MKNAQRISVFFISKRNYSVNRFVLMNAIRTIRRRINEAKNRLGPWLRAYSGDWAAACARCMFDSFTDSRWNSSWLKLPSLFSTARAQRNVFGGFDGEWNQRKKTIIIRTIAVDKTKMFTTRTIVLYSLSVTSPCLRHNWRRIRIENITNEMLKQKITVAGSNLNSQENAGSLE